MYKEDLALNTLQWLICHKTKPNLNQANMWGIVYGILAKVLDSNIVAREFAPPLHHYVYI